jgi:polysaccharide biosynthesis transport protein
MAWLRIESSPQYIAFETRSSDTATNQMFVQTQIELLRSPLVLGPMLSDPDIARMPEIADRSDPLEWLGNKISVKPVGASELYKVVYAAPDPKAAAKVVNAAVEAYFQLRGQEDANRSDRVVKILEQERENRAREVALLRDAVRDLAKQATGKDPFAGTVEPVTIVNHPLAELQNHIVTAEVDQEVLKARIKAMQEVASREIPISEASIENKIASHPEVLRFKEAIASLQIQLRTIDSYSPRGEKDPATIHVTRQIREYEKSLAQLRKDLRQQVQAELQSTAAAKRDEQTAALQSDLESRKIAIGVFKEKYNNQMTDVKQTSSDTLQLMFKQGELERAERIYSLIAERIVKLRTEKGAPERIVLMKSAAVPASPVESIPFSKMLMAALVGFALPFGLALGWEKLLRRVGDVANLENESRLQVVGEIARLPARRVGAKRGAARQLGVDLQLYEESIDSLRTTLMLTDELRDLRVLAVTSASTHEGKTSVAAQLAMSLARTTDHATLLIDGDMRAPDLHDIFEVPLEPGLTKVLTGAASIEEAIVATACPKLDLLPAGKLANNPHKLLGNGASASLLQAIPSKYRYIIIDTPPVLAASEALMLATLADASLVCVLRDVSRIDQIKKAYQRLVVAGGKPVGLVLNGGPSKTYAYHYGSYAYVKR